MPQRHRLRDETSAAESPAAGWDPYEVWYTRVHLPRLERERAAAEQLPPDELARAPA